MTSYISKRYHNKCHLGLVDNVPWPACGYFSGGNNYSGESNLTDRITFSDGITAAHTVSNLSAARTEGSAVSDKVNYGYFLGGYGALYTDRIDFTSTITSANTVSNLIQGRDLSSSLSDGNSYGYICGGLGGSQLSSIEKITFSSGIVSTNTSGSLSQARSTTSAVSDGISYGYISGGWTGYTEVALTLCDRIVFSNSTVAAKTVANLIQGRWFPVGLSDGSLYGYVGGGKSVSTYTQDPVVTVDRITFSSGTDGANTAGNLTSANSNMGSSSDGRIYGYFSGGYGTAQRVTFSSSIISTNTASNLSVNRINLSGLSDCAV
jgi:hypothetical protein